MIEPRTLYICYFGLREPLVQTQVIPYLQETAKGAIRVDLLTFEPEMKKNWTPETIAATRENLAATGIEWYCLAYHKRPSAIATAFDVVNGVRFIRKNINRYDVLHGRVHVPTLMGALARKLSKHKPKLIFDIRGFFPEEYTDAGVWPENGTLYQTAKRVERWLLKEADGFVVLTEAAKEILFGANSAIPHSALRTPHFVEVIPCCVDLESRFPPDLPDSRTKMRKKLGVDGRFVVTHVGALGGLYLTREIVEFLDAARSVEPSTYAMFLTQTDPSEVTALLRERAFSDNDYFVGRVTPAEIPNYLSAAEVGLSFVKPANATQSRSPTKIPEYLAAGLPIIANSGVGDVDKLINENGVGVLIDGFDQETYLDALERLDALGDIAAKCRETAQREFDLRTVGGPRYLRLYRKLLENR
jgi:glycosyltransferase involved in cell wall biosynthesis